MDSASPDALRVTPERVQRMIDALALIGVDQHDRALDLLPELAEMRDEIDLLESCVRVLIEQVAESQAANDRYAQALEESRQHLADKLELIQRQTIALADLSTPIIEVWDGTLVLPIIGAIDAPRAAAIAATLLRSITDLRARHVLLDLTGVETIDAVTFEHLSRLVRAAELLGARCTLTGLSPAVAAAVVGLGLDHSVLHTRATLKEGLRDVVARQQPPSDPPRRR
ncbi:MAG: STAS domain-containing protein [Myxococcales bacterium]|nr:STAS domain-containing protein [Myxococcales bacterium]